MKGLLTGKHVEYERSLPDARGADCAMSPVRLKTADDRSAATIDKNRRGLIGSICFDQVIPHVVRSDGTSGINEAYLFDGVKH